MNQEDLVETLKFIRPNAEFIIRGDDLEWLDQQQEEPTEAEIKAGFIALQDKIKSDKVATEAKRAAALSKLETLGLDVDDLKALGLG